MTIDNPSHDWPDGDTADCACPHCGNSDSFLISNARQFGINYRDAECTACFGDYCIVALNGVVTGEKLPNDSLNFLIHHRYDIGDQGVSVKVPNGFDVRRAAVYIQFMAEIWFGAEKAVTNLGIASALVSFYGCKHAARNARGEVVDMYTDREIRCGQAEEIMADGSLHREGLRDFLFPHLEG